MDDPVPEVGILLASHLCIDERRVFRRTGIYSDEEVSLVSTDAIERQCVVDTSVDKDVTVEVDGGKESGDRDRTSDGLGEGAFVEDLLFAADEIAGHAAEGYREMLDGDVVGK